MIQLEGHERSNLSAIAEKVRKTAPSLSMLEEHVALFDGEMNRNGVSTNGAARHGQDHLCERKR